CALLAKSGVSVASGVSGASYKPPLSAPLLTPLTPLAPLLLRPQPNRLIVLRFKLVQRIRVAQRQSDIVQPFEQAEPAEWIDFELRAEPTVVRHRLRFKRDRQLIAGNRLCVFEQLIHLIFAQPRQDDPVLA